MPVDLAPLAGVHRLLFAIPLQPLQGKRFQATGFPGLGAATYQTKDGQSLLVESAQSTANRLEKVVWDDATQDLVPALKGLSHVRVVRGKGSSLKERQAVHIANKQFLTCTLLDAHRLNSAYLLEGSDKSFMNRLKNELKTLDDSAPDRRELARVLLKYDIGSLLHGVFLAKKELAGGRHRVARAISGFVEADGVRTAPSGGVKNDHVRPGKVVGDTKNHFGNIPFARDEFTADSITLYVNIDLAQIRGYGLGDKAEKMLTLLSLWKVRAMLDGGLRLRTACYLQIDPNLERIVSTNVSGFALPLMADIQPELTNSIEDNKSAMDITTVSFDDDLTVAQNDPDQPESEDDDE
jgi:CRISPR-associated protein Csb1